MRPWYEYANALEWGQAYIKEYPWASPHVIAFIAAMSKSLWNDLELTRSERG